MSTLLSYAQPTTAPSFSALLSRAMRKRGTDGRDYALDFGVNEEALVRYSNGAVSDDERECIQRVMLRNKWSRDYVVNYVKSKRKRKRNAA